MFSCSQPASTHRQRSNYNQPHLQAGDENEKSGEKQSCACERDFSLGQLASLTPREFLMDSQSSEANQKCDFISHFESNTYRVEEKKEFSLSVWNI